VIEIRDRQIVIDSQPRLVISGEIHYFRLQREEWEDRILKLKAAGGNAVASYIPWLCHELPNGEIDLNGHTRLALDLGAFIDLCHEHGLWFIARPGPFIMAEMKNEGVPYRLYTDHPELIPVTWDGREAPSRTLDYCAPAFLDAARGWYAQVIPILAKRQVHRGGNVIAVQLDNEIGMLSWVTNSPDLTDVVMQDMYDWLVARDGASEVAARYDLPPDDPAAFAATVRSPEEPIAGVVMRDLGWFMRERFARYVASLRGFAEEFGISGIPFLVNIHGTDAGRGEPFPIGISQLYRSYTQGPGFLAGSDHYLGDLTRVNAPDLYLMNAFMEAVNRPEQPLTSMEFEAGSGDYGQVVGARSDPSAADFKLRMSVAQGNRLINYYLFTGGVNYRMEIETGDGNDRISFTGERHGTGAPIDPEGRESYTLARLARTNRMLAEFADKVAVATEERDAVAMGFIPDYFMTESVYPESPFMSGLAENLRRHRFGGPETTLARAMQQLTFRFTAVNIQDVPLDVEAVPALALASARFMDALVQRKLVDWLEAGGRLFLHGEVPRFDMTGDPCTVLMDAFGLRYVDMRWGSHRYFPSLIADGWAAPRAELRAGWAQGFAPVDGQTLFWIYGTEEACAFDIEVGPGRAIVVAAEIPADLEFFAEAFRRLDVRPGLRHDHPLRGIFLTSTATPSGERFVHALNLDGVDKSLHILDGDAPLCEGREVMLRRRDGVMLPVGIDLGGVTVVWSTAEVVARYERGLTLRLTGDADVILLRTDREVAVSDDYDIARRDDGALVTSRIRGTGEDLLEIAWR
jgi:beta-galactosidase